MSPGELHCYEVTLSEGQYLQLFIEPRYIQTNISLYGPDNQVLVQQNCRYHGPTPLSVVAQSSGAYRLA
ncbi:MAG: hypothetical protein ACRD8U_22585, partial [Pyrinomonadaceae bacterium]